MILLIHLVRYGGSGVWLAHSTQNASLPSFAHTLYRLVQEAAVGGLTSRNQNFPLPPQTEGHTTRRKQDVGSTSRHTHLSRWDDTEQRVQELTYGCLCNVSHSITHQVKMTQGSPEQKVDAILEQAESSPWCLTTFCECVGQKIG